MKIITVTNAKGGTGKTTTAVNIAYSLSRSGKVLLIDTDPQGSIRHYLGIPQTAAGLYESLKRSQMVEPYKAYGLDVITASLELAAAEHELNTTKGGETVLTELIRPVKSLYDFIILDTAPSLTMLSVNSITAADVVLIPVIPEYLSIAGLKNLENVIDRIGERYRKALKYCLLATMYQPRRVIHKTVFNLLSGSYGSKLIGSVKAAVSVVESSAAQMPIALYSPKSVATENYSEAAANLLKFIEEQ